MKTSNRDNIKPMMLWHRFKMLKHKKFAHMHNRNKRNFIKFQEIRDKRWIKNRSRSTRQYNGSTMPQDI